MLLQQQTDLRFSIDTLNLDTQRLFELEYDLRRFFPNIRLVRVVPGQCDWETRAQEGEIWTEHRTRFLLHHQRRIQVLVNPPDPLLDTDIYNVGLLQSPSLLHSFPLEAYQIPGIQVGDIIHGGSHGFGFWYEVLSLHREDLTVDCLPASPPTWSHDAVPRFLYRVQRAWNTDEISWWCPACWKEAYSLDGATTVLLSNLTEAQHCVICERDFCADDATAPPWAEYFYRHLWRRAR